jgi:transposase
VSRSRLKPVVEVAQMLKRHLDNLLTYLKHHITNAKHAVCVRGGNDSFEPR